MAGIKRDIELAEKREAWTQQHTIVIRGGLALMAECAARTLRLQNDEVRGTVDGKVAHWDPSRDEPLPVSAEAESFDDMASLKRDIELEEKTGALGPSYLHRISGCLGIQGGASGTHIAAPKRGA